MSSVKVGRVEIEQPFSQGEPEVVYSRQVEFRCLFCNAWFQSPVPVTDTAKYRASAPLALFTICRNCHKAVPCNFERMRVVPAGPGAALPAR